jgi:hypothetical protein
VEEWASVRVCIEILTLRPPKIERTKSVHTRPPAPGVFTLTSTHQQSRTLLISNLKMEPFYTSEWQVILSTPADHADPLRIPLRISLRMNTASWAQHGLRAYDSCCSVLDYGDV